MLIKTRFLKDGEPRGREYTYISDIDVAVGDKVRVGNSEMIVITLNVPEEEVEAFKDKLKKIDGKVEVKEDARE